MKKIRMNKSMSNQRNSCNEYSCNLYRSHNCHNRHRGIWKQQVNNQEKMRNWKVILVVINNNRWFTTTATKLFRSLLCLEGMNNASLNITHSVKTKIPHKWKVEQYTTANGSTTRGMAMGPRNGQTVRNTMGFERMIKSTASGNTTTSTEISTRVSWNLTWQREQVTTSIEMEENMSGSLKTIASMAMELKHLTITPLIRVSIFKEKYMEGVSLILLLIFIWNRNVFREKCYLYGRLE